MPKRTGAPPCAARFGAECPILRRKLRNPVPGLTLDCRTCRWSATVVMQRTTRASLELAFPPAPTPREQPQTVGTQQLEPSPRPAGRLHWRAWRLLMGTPLWAMDHGPAAGGGRRVPRMILQVPVCRVVPYVGKSQMNRRPVPGSGSRVREGAVCPERRDCRRLVRGRRYSLSDHFTKGSLCGRF